MNSPKMSGHFRQHSRLTQRPGQRLWTAKEITELKGLAKDGLSSAQIGIILNRSAKSIQGACAYHKIKLKIKRWGWPRPTLITRAMTQTERSRRWRAKLKLRQKVEK